MLLSSGLVYTSVHYNESLSHHCDKQTPTIGSRRWPHAATRSRITDAVFSPGLRLTFLTKVTRPGDLYKPTEDLAKVHPAFFRASLEPAVV